MRHWSARGLFDRNKALWASFVLETPAGKLYIVCDSGYGEGKHFRRVAEAHGPLRLAILPIGAYEPRWFMRDQHMNPDDAVRALLACGAAIAEIKAEPTEYNYQINFVFDAEAALAAPEVGDADEALGVAYRTPVPPHEAERTRHPAEAECDEHERDAEAQRVRKPQQARPHGIAPVHENDWNRRTCRLRGCERGSE